MKLVGEVTEIERISLDDARAAGRIRLIGSEVDRPYRQDILQLSLQPRRSATVAYSPIHGAGITNVLPVLQEAGFRVALVRSQAEFDGAFPTAYDSVLDPEYPQVMRPVLREAEITQADVALMSDPDADRIGVAVRHEGVVQLLTGNEVGIVLAAYVLGQLHEQGRLPEGGVVAKTAVTTGLITRIAASYGLRTAGDLLVGFKYVADVIEHLPDKHDFVFAAEESLGYLRGTFVRDKDAAIAALLLAEAASWLKDSNRTMIDYLDEIYRQHGYFHNYTVAKAYAEGREGHDLLRRVMTGLRRQPPTELGGRPVLEVIDRLPRPDRAAKRYTVGATGDQLTFRLSEDGQTWVTVRPSGTEPVLKYYVQHFGAVPEGQLRAVQAAVDAEAERLRADILALGQQLAAA
jgi:phosphoglucomutase/phosphomannomutase